ncbi:hypothetical protein CEUSTIGMA_g7073.t1 [Chlamydomonas eustigma]|uniref:Sec39 domain-containing protein n=1 Tax=Chlamydomonas eustigma TaxID=1157962 RepID=A0A250X9U7_9CHLO|nr:hypothetical protein CEUSTIGMA_g7073.t1 [Chlamydomonas eustigma]|eukprot:GAX79632.1 hypothetical protein CEUSTIGMA_g7073.t1 [Chlamydomonas eustigma]
MSETILTETLLLHEECSVSERRSGIKDEGLLSPDETHLAVIEASKETVCILHLQDPNLHSSVTRVPQGSTTIIKRFSALKAPTLKPQNSSKTDQDPDSPYERILAVCWYPDSSKLVISCAGGSIYIVEKAGTLFCAYMPEKTPFPWTLPAAAPVVSMLMPSADRVLLVTLNALLYILPFASAVAGPETFSALKPMNMKVHHGSIYGMVLDPSSQILAILGEGTKSKVLSGLSLTLWACLPGTPMKLMSSLGMPAALRKATSKTKAAAPLLPSHFFSMSFSPTSDFLAIAAPPQGAVLISRDGKVVDLGALEDNPGSRNVRSMTVSCTSVGWWGGSVLAMCNGVSGQVALAGLPSFDNLLGARGDLLKVQPGCQLYCLNKNEDNLGMLLLEPWPEILSTPAVEAAAGPTALPGGLLPPAAASAAAITSGAGWKVSIMAERTAEEMVAIHMKAQQWEAALLVAIAYHLDCDHIYKARWQSKPVTAVSIAENLHPMADRFAVAEMCAARVADSYEAQQMLIEFCIAESALHCTWVHAEEVHDPESVKSNARWWRSMRLMMLSQLDRLKTLKAVHKGIFDGAAFSAFKEVTIQEAALQYAAAGDVSALALMLQHHPVVLGAALLGVLDALPETLDPRLYAQLLPKVDGLPSLNPLHVGIRAADWVESYEVAIQLQEDNVLGLISATDNMLYAAQGGVIYTPTEEQVCVWYCKRALALDAISGQLQHAITLLECGAQRGLQGGVMLLLSQAKALRTLLAPRDALGGGHDTMHSQEHTSPEAADKGFSSSSWLLTLEEFSQKDPQAQLLLLLTAGLSGQELAGCSDNKLDLVSKLDRAIATSAGPYCLSLPPAQCAVLLQSVLETQVAEHPAWCAALVGLETQRRRLFPNDASLVEAVVEAVSSCYRVDAWYELKDMLNSMQVMLHQRGLEEVSLLEEVSDLLTMVSAAELMTVRGVPLTVGAVRNADSHQAHGALIALLTSLSSSSKGWSDKDWRRLWSDLMQISKAGGFSCLDPRELLSGFVRTLLDAGRVSIAHAFLAGEEAEIPPLPPQDVERLVLAVASQLLRSATSLDHPSISQARGILTLAPPEAHDAQAELRRLAVLPRLVALRLPLQPKDVLTEKDPLNLLRKVLEAGREHDMYRRVPDLLNLAEIIGLPEAAQQVDLLAATEALSLGDLPEATALALRLVGGRYGPAWRLAATIGMEVGNSKKMSVSDIKASGYLNPVKDRLKDEHVGESEDNETVRCRLLAFAAARCDAEALPQLLEELAEGEKRKKGGDWIESHLELPLELLVSRALLKAQGHKEIDSMCAPAANLNIPSLGDTPVALSQLLKMPSQDILQCITSLVESGTPHASVQRVLLAGVAATAMQVLLPAAASPQERMSLLHLSFPDLLYQARSKASTVQGQKMVAGFEQLLAQLRATEDSRSVRAVVPMADPGAFSSGNKEGQRKAVLKQAEVAGSQAAQQPTQPAKLLEESVSLGRGYGVADAWEVRLRFVVGLVAENTAGGTVQELRALAITQTKHLLQEAQEVPGNVKPKAALRLLTAMSQEVWPSASQHSTSSSSSRLSCCLSIMILCLESVSAPTPGGLDALHVGEEADLQEVVLQLLPKFQKLRDLLDKAGNALKGLHLATLLTPFLRACLLPFTLSHQHLGAQDASGTSGNLSAARSLQLMPASLQLPDPDMPKMLSDAQASLFSYVTSTTLANAAKFVKALHATFSHNTSRGPSSSGGASPTLPQHHASSALLSINSAMRTILSSIPVSLPHFSLLLKLTATVSATVSAGPSPPSAPALITSEIWSQACSICKDKISSGQLRSWMEFTLCGGRQPLPEAVTGRLVPIHFLPETRMGVLQDCLPRLLQVAAVHSQSQHQTSDVLPELAAKLLHQYHKLKVWAALQEFIPHAHIPDEVQMCVFDASDPLSSATASDLLLRCLVSFMAAGSSVDSLMALVEAAAAPAGATSADDPISEPAEPGALPRVPVEPHAIIHEALSSTLGTCLPVLLPNRGAWHADLSRKEAAPALNNLRGIIICLTNRSSPDSCGGSRSDVLLKGLRDAAYKMLQEAVNGMESTFYSQPEVVEVLELMSSITSGQIWLGWSAQDENNVIQSLPADSSTVEQGSPHFPAAVLGGGSTLHLQRLLLGRTLATLEGAWDLRPDEMTVEHVADVDAGRSCFRMLLSSATGVRQLRLLKKLLQVTWKDGQVWGACPLSGILSPHLHSTLPDVTSDLTTSHESEAMKQDVMESTAVDGCSEGWPISVLHDCWLELSEALLAAGHFFDVVKMVDITAHLVQQGHPAPLSLSGIQALVTAAAKEQNNIPDSAAAAGGENVIKTIVALCLGLLSPSKQQRSHAVQGLESLAVDHSMGHHKPDLTVASCMLVVAAVNSRAGYALCSSKAVWSLTLTALEALPPHPSAAAAVCLPPGAASEKTLSSGDEVTTSVTAAAELAGCVLPVSASELVLEGRAGWGGALVADRLRLHPAFASLGGSCTYMERYLKDSMLISWSKNKSHQDVAMLQLQPEDVLASAGLGVSPSGHILSSSVVQCLCWALPHSLLEIANNMNVIVEEAHKTLARDLGASFSAP